MWKTILEIDGMMCGMCEAHINDAIRSAFAVKKVSSSHSKSRTEILSEEVPNEQILKDVIDKTGYKLQGIRTEVAKEKKFLFF